ncbi:hypothetical protein FCV60_21970 [Vibrio sp. F13]|uniref:hypothetical protein n=1 Tax=Vibrio sp. F13 TaxID=2070777 RepID=UPI0010BD8A71|nr:hypothetical protein [Vibrio sp. F13]TKF49525.1 hypothetical protein FCV60_21970 [Vibrio sp. F13]
MDQIERPLTLRISKVEGDNVVVNVVPLTGLPYMMPWSIARHERTIPLAKDLAGGIDNMHFLDYNCHSEGSGLKQKSWLHMLDRGYDHNEYEGISTLAVDGHMIIAPQGKNLTMQMSGITSANRRMKNMPLGLYIPGYNTPIFISEKLEGLMGNKVFISKPAGITWNLTQSELDVLETGNETVDYSYKKIGKISMFGESL